jgi:hypothetical protein
MSTGWRSVHFRDGDTPVGIDERLIETRGAIKRGFRMPVLVENTDEPQ